MREDTAFPTPLRRRQGTSASAAPTPTCVCLFRSSGCLHKNRGIDGCVTANAVFRGELSAARSVSWGDFSRNTRHRKTSSRTVRSVSSSTRVVSCGAATVELHRQAYGVTIYYMIAQLFMAFLHLVCASRQRTATKKRQNRD